MTGKIMTNTVEENFPSSSKRYHFLYTSCSFIGSIAYVKHTIIIQIVQKSFKTYKNHSNSKKQPKYYMGKQHLLKKQTGRTKKIPYGRIHLSWLTVSLCHQIIFLQKHVQSASHRELRFPFEWRDRGKLQGLGYLGDGADGCVQWAGQDDHC